ncbi:hypothetical protein B0F90DRAFT_1816628 [Multifurca ochricompacta]|uniref:Uncharacterized protein n=1 Tax=Multifurca ochricompacta TaxID=376703 RepID=A0AAD4M6S5_9AGAM|nr:hypothetical protein B0F90DRAFT_1816628 [Multifurca ochricompacta]
MISKTLTAFVFFLTLTSSSVNAHAGVSPALGVKGNLARGNVERPSNADPCGKVDIAQTIGTSTPVVAAADGTFSPSVISFNPGADGSRSIKTVKVDASGTGKNFVAAKVVANGDPAPKTSSAQQIKVQLPPGTKCTGGPKKDLCLASFTTTAGFGNCVVVSQSAAGSKARRALTAEGNRKRAASVLLRAVSSAIAANQNQTVTPAKDDKKAKGQELKHGAAGNKTEKHGHKYKHGAKGNKTAHHGHKHHGGAKNKTHHGHKLHGGAKNKTHHVHKLHNGAKNKTVSVRSDITLALQAALKDTAAKNAAKAAKKEALRLAEKNKNRLHSDAAGAAKALKDAASKPKVLKNAASKPKAVHIGKKIRELDNEVRSDVDQKDKKVDKDAKKDKKDKDAKKDKKKDKDAKKDKKADKDAKQDKKADKDAKQDKKDKDAKQDKKADKDAKQDKKADKDAKQDKKADKDAKQDKKADKDAKKDKKVDKAASKNQTAVKGGQKNNAAAGKPTSANGNVHRSETLKRSWGSRLSAPLA